MLVIKKNYFFIFATVACLLFCGWIIKTQAQAIPGLLFGGRTVFVDLNPATICLPNATSPGGYLFSIAAPKGGNFILTPGTVVYPYGPTRNIGQSILGKPAPIPTACMVPCASIGIPVPGLCPHPASLTTGGAALPVLFQGSSSI